MDCLTDDVSHAVNHNQSDIIVLMNVCIVTTAEDIAEQVAVNLLCEGIVKPGDFLTRLRAVELIRAYIIAHPFEFRNLCDMPKEKHILDAIMRILSSDTEISDLRLRYADTFRRYAEAVSCHEKPCKRRSAFIDLLPILILFVCAMIFFALRYYQFIKTVASP